MTDKEIYENQSRVISSVKVSGISESMWASGYPMLAEIKNEVAYLHSSSAWFYLYTEQDKEKYNEIALDEGSGYFLTAEEVEKYVARAKKLGTTQIGSGHDNFLNGIIAQFDLTFTIKAWTEAERYHFFDFVSSQSTMHRLQKMDISKACIEYVDERVINVVKELVEKYNENPTLENRLRMLYSCPTGLKLTARMTTNYRQLKTIYNQRKNHTLPEWRAFCKQIEEEFPLFKELCLGDEK